MSLNKIAIRMNEYQKVLEHTKAIFIPLFGLFLFVFFSCSGNNFSSSFCCSFGFFLNLFSACLTFVCCTVCNAKKNFARKTLKSVRNSLSRFFFLFPPFSLHLLIVSQPMLLSFSFSLSPSLFLSFSLSSGFLSKFL